MEPKALVFCCCSFLLFLLAAPCQQPICQRSSSLLWTMSGSVDNAPCMNFEANIFAKSLCQHCFRAAGAHQQHALQVSLSIPPGGYEYFIKGPFVPGGDSMCLCRDGNH